jgi:hypothetical protein
VIFLHNRFTRVIQRQPCLLLVRICIQFTYIMSHSLFLAIGSLKQDFIDNEYRGSRNVRGERHGFGEYLISTGDLAGDSYKGHFFNGKEHGWWLYQSYTSLSGLRIVLVHGLYVLGIWC